MKYRPPSGPLAAIGSLSCGRDRTARSQGPAPFVFLSPWGMADDALWLAVVAS